MPWKRNLSIQPEPGWRGVCALPPRCIRKTCYVIRSQFIDFLGPEDQSTTRPQDQRTTGPEDQRTTGPEDQRTKGPEDQRTTGPEDHRTRGPKDQRTTGPEDQTTRGPKDQTTTFRVLGRARSESRSSHRYFVAMYKKYIVSQGCGAYAPKDMLQVCTEAVDCVAL